MSFVCSTCGKAFAHRFSRNRHSIVVHRSSFTPLPPPFRRQNASEAAVETAVEGQTSNLCDERAESLQGGNLVQGALLPLRERPEKKEDVGSAPPSLLAHEGATTRTELPSGSGASNYVPEAAIPKKAVATVGCQTSSQLELNFFSGLTYLEVIRVTRSHPDWSEAQILRHLSGMRPRSTLDGASREQAFAAAEVAPSERDEFLRCCHALMLLLPIDPETGRRDLRPFVAFLEDQALRGLDPGLLPGTVVFAPISVSEMKPFCKG